MPEISILLPHGEVEGRRAQAAARLGPLAGKRIGFLDNGLWGSMRVLADELAKQLSAAHGATAAQVVHSGTNHGQPEAYRAELERFAGEVDAVVSGLGN